MIISMNDNLIVNVSNKQPNTKDVIKKKSLNKKDFLKKISFDDLIEFSCSENIRELVEKFLKHNIHYFLKNYNCDIEDLVFSYIFEYGYKQYYSPIEIQKKNEKKKIISDYFESLGYVDLNIQDLCAILYLTEDALANKAIKSKLNLFFKKLKVPEISSGRKGSTYYFKKQKIKAEILETLISLFIRKMKLV